MLLCTQEKKGIIEAFAQTGKSDTGSPEVQIALLTERIKQLTEHFKTHKKDVVFYLNLTKIKLLNLRALGQESLAMVVL